MPRALAWIREARRGRTPQVEFLTIPPHKFSCLSSVHSVVVTKASKSGATPDTLKKHQHRSSLQDVTERRRHTLVRIRTSPVAQVAVPERKRTRHRVCVQSSSKTDLRAKSPVLRECHTESLHDRLQDWVHSCREHETRENELVQDASGSDISGAN